MTLVNQNPDLKDLWKLQRTIIKVLVNRIPDLKDCENRREPVSKRLSWIWTRFWKICENRMEPVRKWRSWIVTRTWKICENDREPGSKLSWIETWTWNLAWTTVTMTLVNRNPALKYLCEPQRTGVKMTLVNRNPVRKSKGVNQRSKYVTRVTNWVSLFQISAED